MNGGEAVHLEEINFGDRYLSVKAFSVDSGLGFIFSDITNRVLLNKELEASLEFTKQIISNTPIGIAIYDAVSGNCVAANKSMSELIGNTEEELLNQNFKNNEFWDNSGLKKCALEALETDSFQHIEIDMQTSTGKRMLTYNQLGPFYDGSSRYLLLTSQNSTELNEAVKKNIKLEKQLMQSQKMEAIGTLAGGVAHDFNNLLMVLIGEADFLINELKGKELQDSARQIMKTSERASSLTRQLLAFSRREIISPKVINLNDTLQEQEKMLRRLIGEHIDYICEYGADLYNTKLDPGQIEQLVMNLAINARDAMPNGGELWIETTNKAVGEDFFSSHGEVLEPGDYVVISISDNGKGISEDELPRIFEPFYTTKSKSEGSGLGLSTVYGIAKQNKGHVTVYSEVGKGTTFKIYFPKYVGPSETAKETRQFIDINAEGVILLVEDDNTVLATIKKYLESTGFEVMAANHPDEAIKIFDDHSAKIKLLLTDVIMPGKSGKELAKELHARSPKLPVLYMSGYTENAIVHHGILADSTNFINKPFSREDLLGKLNEILE